MDTLFVHRYPYYCIENWNQHISVQFHHHLLTMMLAFWALLYNIVSCLYCDSDAASSLYMNILSNWFFLKKQLWALTGYKWF